MRIADFNNLTLLRSTKKAGRMKFYSDVDEEVVSNRQRFLSLHGIKLEDIVGLEQVHGNKIIKVSTKDKSKGSRTRKNAFVADGLITSDPQVFLTVVTADCNQIALYDPSKKTIALLHAGIKGLSLGIIKVALDTLETNFGSSPENIIAELGPSVGPCHYKTDIWDIAESQLKDCGIKPENIFNPRICTYDSPDYYSHRASDDMGQDTTDRFITAFGMKNI